MSEKTMTLVDLSPPGSSEPREELPPLTAAEQDTVRELVPQARASGPAVSGRDGRAPGSGSSPALGAVRRAGRGGSCGVEGGGGQVELAGGVVQAAVRTGRGSS